MDKWLCILGCFAGVVALTIFMFITNAAIEENNRQCGSIIFLDDGR